LNVDEATPVTEVNRPIVTVSFVTPVSLAVFFDVSTDDGVEPVEPPVVAGAPVVPGAAEPTAAVVAGAADVAGAAVVPDEPPELLPHAAATSPTVQSTAADLIRFMIGSPPVVTMRHRDGRTGSSVRDASPGTVHVVWQGSS
jgi:hypothetical protein